MLRSFFRLITVSMAWAMTLTGTDVLAQSSSEGYQLSGYILDAASGEALIGATVWCTSINAGVSSNTYGYYSLQLPTGPQKVSVSFIGFQTQSYEFDLKEDQKMDVELASGVAIQEAIVTGESFNRIEDQVQMSKMEIPMDQVRRLPAIGGEVDLLKSLQLMPGVQSGGEGTSGLYVRGGSPDQNLIVLDGVPLYSVSHLFGFFLCIQCRCGEANEHHQRWISRTVRRSLVFRIGSEHEGRQHAGVSRNCKRFHPRL